MAGKSYNNFPLRQSRPVYGALAGRVAAMGVWCRDAIERARSIANVGRDLVRDERGALMAEYVILLGLVSLGIAASIAGLGPALLASFERARGILIGPFP